MNFARASISKKTLDVSRPRQARLAVAVAAAVAGLGCSSSTMTVSKADGGSSGDSTGAGSGGKDAAGGQSSGGSATSAGGTHGKGGSSSVGMSSASSGGTTTSGGSSVTGGTSSAGGSPATGGTSSAGGSSVTGGTSSAGGSSAKGGTSSAGGTSSTGGTTAASSTTPPVNQFSSGPCITSPDLASVEVFANGGNQHIYRRVINGTSLGAWSSVAGLNAGLLDVSSDLDCSANTTTIHLAASGASPSGAYMHATGFGTFYNQFVQEQTGTVFSRGVSIAVPYNTEVRFEMAAVLSTAPQWSEVVNGGAPSALSPNWANAITSAPDVAHQLALNSSHHLMVAFDNTASLVLFDYYSGSSSSWWDPQHVTPPASKTFSYSPTICTQTDYASGNFKRHIAAVAGGKLWYAVSGIAWPTVFSAWEQVSSVDMGSSPDCVVTTDNTVHLAARTAAGTIVDVHGTPGSWTTTDLGGY